MDSWFDVLRQVIDVYHEQDRANNGSHKKGLVSMVTGYRQSQHTVHGC